MTPSIIIIFGCLAMSILAIGIVLFVIAYQKRVLANQNELAQAENRFQAQLIEATLTTEQQEREKIARNLHDDIGTSLNILRLNLEKIKRNASRAETAEKTADTALEMVSSTIQNLRMVSRDLMPATLTKIGLVESLDELFKQINESGATSIELVVPETNAKIDNKTGVQLYRICQEVINNLLKHGNASAIKVYVTLLNEKNFSMEVHHNGVKFTDDDVKKLYDLNRGVGLKSIESRTRMINASIHYKHNDHGSIIEIKSAQA
ncbi:MAG TPA: histidine kinase [Flavobacteriales bacterium]|nr:histidine kinase [Flavobacteriales bacterium]